VKWLGLDDEQEGGRVAGLRGGYFRREVTWSVTEKYCRLKSSTLVAAVDRERAFGIV